MSVSSGNTPSMTPAGSKWAGSQPRAGWGTVALFVVATYGVLGLVYDESRAYTAGLFVLFVALPLVAALVVALRRWHWRRSVL